MMMFYMNPIMFNMNPMMGNMNNMMNNNLMMGNMNNMLNNNPMMGNMNNMMNNNLMMGNMNNMMNNNLMMGNMNNMMNMNPMMGNMNNMMNQINPFMINQFKKLENNSNKNLKEEYINDDNEIIPEYQTLDDESNPINKYIENAINLSYIMKLEVLKQKSQNPELLINIANTLSHPGLLENQNPKNEDYKYILSLIGKILENNGITVGIYKYYDIKDRIDLVSIQLIFSGLINKKNLNYFLMLVKMLSSLLKLT